MCEYIIHCACMRTVIKSLLHAINQCIYHQTETLHQKRYLQWQLRRNVIRQLWGNVEKMTFYYNSFIRLMGQFMENKVFNNNSWIVIEIMVYSNRICRKNNWRCLWLHSSIYNIKLCDLLGFYFHLKQIITWKRNLQHHSVLKYTFW